MGFEANPLFTQDVKVKTKHNPAFDLANGGGGDGGADGGDEEATGFGGVEEDEATGFPSEDKPAPERTTSNSTVWAKPSVREQPAAPEAPMSPEEQKRADRRAKLAASRAKNKEKEEAQLLEFLKIIDELEA